LSRRAAALGALMAAGPALAGQVSVEPQVQAHRLQEFRADGSTLVTERGASPGLRVAWSHRRDDGWGLRLAAGGWAGTADYDGRTQSGVRATSETRTSSATVEASALWAASPAWTLEGGVQWEAFRRRIVGIQGSSGLDERLRQPRLRLGVAWATGPWSVQVAALHGEPAPLEVRFDSGVFDPAQLRSGRARGASVELGRELAPAWRLAAGAEWLSVDAGAAGVLQSDGRPVGTVMLPKWQRERLWLALQWSPG
jgi:hypothetical protein